MAAAKAALTEYERRRLENIKRNEEMIASIKRKANDLSTLIKSSKRKPHRIAKPGKTPVVLRRSLRSRGISPDSAQETAIPTTPSPPVSLAKQKGPLRIVDDFVATLAATILDAEENAPLHRRVESLQNEVESWNPASALSLVPENTRRLLAGRILTVCFFPFLDRRLLAVGDKYGNLGFWDADFGESEGDGSYVYTPHSAPVSGISLHPFSSSKVFTCSYDGFIRLMDVGETVFKMIYSTEDSIFSLIHHPNNTKSLYFGEGQGDLKMWDESAGKISSSWDLHEQRINTIDFNRYNANLMATSSTDGIASIWDLRKIHSKKPECITTAQHARAVHSAYFSPSGTCLATTSIDDTVGILSGPSFDNWTTIKHFNQTGRWLSSFRAIWGWDDRFLFMGNMRRAVDIITVEDKNIVPLESPFMTAIPCRFAVHPQRVGLLAGATAGGQIYIWS
ncbi:DROUGHT SENSITIVE 1 isoform X1 [Wolffia australiana]